MTQPEVLIVSVLVWTVHEDKRTVDVHLVAATGSRDAEQRIMLSADRSHFTGLGKCAFILTDEHLERRGSAIRCYSTRFTNEENISDANFDSWVRHNTRGHCVDGNHEPAAFRELRLPV